MLSVVVSRAKSEKHFLRGSAQEGEKRRGKREGGQARESDSKNESRACLLYDTFTVNVPRCINTIFIKLMTMN